MAINQQPIIILVEPQMGENIGMCARAMLNCGLERLRLVNPRQGWPNEAARATAADADHVLEGAEVFESLDAALGDCQRIFATTARERSLALPVLPVGEAVVEVAEANAAGGQVAILFGPEASGLDNEAISRADRLLRFPTNPKFSSLNLAQAVLLFSWEWKNAAQPKNQIESFEVVSQDSLSPFLSRLEQALDERGFFLTPEMKPHSVRTLRALFTKSSLTEQELQLMHGVLTALLKEPNSDDLSVGHTAEQ